MREVRQDRAYVDQRAINEAKGKYGGDGRDGFGGSGAMGG